MQQGKLTERITIEQLGVGKDASGGMNRSWSVVDVGIAASRRDFAGTEKPATAAAGGEMSTSRVEFTIHWRPDITDTMRVLHEGQVLNIRHVNNFAGRRQSLILTCDLGAGDG